MRKHVKEIENVLQHHGYSINNIICEVMKTFKLKTLCRQVGFQKQAGYSTSETLTLILMLPLKLLKSVAKSGLVNILEFRNSIEYEYLKDLFENSFLTNQLKNLEKAS